MVQFFNKLYDIVPYARPFLPVKFFRWENQDWACLLASKVKNKDSLLGKKGLRYNSWLGRTFCYLRLAGSEERILFSHESSVSYQPNSPRWLLKNRFGRKQSNFGNFLVEYSWLNKLCIQLPQNVTWTDDYNQGSHVAWKSLKIAVSAGKALKFAAYFIQLRF